VPGPASRVGARVRGVRQRPVHGPSLFRRGGAVDNRTHEGTAEDDAKAHRYEPVSLRGGCGIGWEGEPRGRPPRQRRIAGGVGRRDQQEPLSFRGKGLVPPEETALKPSRRPRRARGGDAVRQVGQRDQAGQFKQRQRVAARLGDDLLTHLPFDRPRPDRPVEQRPRVTAGQAADNEFGQAGKTVVACLGGEHHRHRIRLEAAGGERECLGRRVVKPLGVVHDAQQGLPLAGCGQQAEHGQSDEKPVGRIPRRRTEQGVQRLTLRSRQRRRPVKQRETQLVQRGVRDLRLRFHARHGNDVQALRRAGGVFQQGRLADPGLAPDHEDRTPPAAGRLRQPVQQRALIVPADQDRAPTDHGRQK
jgi:hypothetical protein